MTDAEIQLFKHRLECSEIYLEYGSGGSTILAVGQGTIKEIVSVESDKAFATKTFANHTDVLEAQAEGRLRFKFVNIGDIGVWGQPIDEVKSHIWPCYATCPFIEDFKPDLVLVDGRFRIACAIVAAIECPHATILMHDYTIRDRYHTIERFLIKEECVDTLAQFRVNPRIDMQLAKAALKPFLYQPSDMMPTRWARVRSSAGRMLRRLGIYG